MQHGVLGRPEFDPCAHESYKPTDCRCDGFVQRRSERWRCGDFDSEYTGLRREAEPKPFGDGGQLRYAGMVEARRDNVADIRDPKLDDRACGTAARPDRVNDDGTVIPGEDLEQCKARSRAFHDVGHVVDLVPQCPHCQDTDGIVPCVFIAETEDERTQGQPRWISRTSEPPASRISTISGIWPGKLCVAQPKQGS